LKDSFLYKFTNGLWAAIALFVVLMALYVSIGRFLMVNVAAYQEGFLRELNARLNFVVEADQLRGSWSYLTPHLELRGVRLLGDPHAEVALELEKLSVGFDVLESLRTLSLQLISLSGSGLRIHADIDEDGSISLPGVPEGEGMGYQLLRFILNTKRMHMNDLALTLHKGDMVREVHSSATLLREEQFRRFTMSILSPSQQSWFRVVAEGSGDPVDFSSFLANLHVNFYIPEAEQFSELTELAGIAVDGGQIGGELWLSISEGELRSAANFSSTDLELYKVSDPERLMRLDQLAATVRADYIDGGWNFGASDLLARDQEQEFSLQTANGEYRNGTLQLRTSAVDVTQLCLYLLGENLLPRNLESALAALQPTGVLTRLELGVADTSAPLQSWLLSANFERLAVQSWRGAPVLENAAGYLSMGAESGLVQLRSRDFGLGFPKLFPDTLRYAEFETELRWWVEKDWFRLNSGPFTGSGEEGTVQGLFSLTAPLGPSIVGPEMELMVGLSDAHPRYRSKYLPYTLSEQLLSWLGSSIGEGRISDGGFLWRGSLRKGARDFRTIQLYFNVSDTELVYHPAWPPLDDIEGHIVIDDLQVDVRARSARIHDSLVENTIVSLRQDENEHMILGVSAMAQGDASDGLLIVNQSPLRKLVGDSFAEWQLQGELLTRLQLEMDLTDSTVPPVIEVQARFDDVDLNTGKLGLEVRKIAGDLNFDSQHGFSADALRGELWQKPLRADISQGSAGKGLAELDIAITGVVAVDAVREWLRLDLLRLAEGEAVADMRIRMPPGGTATLEISSELQGVSLDLPESFAKTAQSTRLLSLKMPLAGDARRLILDLGQEVELGLLLGEAGYDGGAMGFGGPALPAESGSFRVSGHLSHFSWEPWYAFVDKYLGLGESAFTAGLLFSASDLSIAEVQAFGGTVHDLVLDARQSADKWQLDFVLPWVQGNLNLDADLAALSLTLDRLDLSGVEPGLLPSETIEGEKFILPPTKIAVKELIDADGVLGNLDFHLRQDGRNYHFDNIRGELRGLMLGGDEELQVDWIRGEHVASTQLRGPLTFMNFGDVLAHYDYDQVVETNSGQLALNLAWPGGPSDFELVKTNGSIGIAVDEGRFLKTSGATEGTLRVVGIVNLAEFVRRLSLDLSYLFQSGVAFDSITGEILFQDGKIEVPQVDVLGRSSRFQFAGLFDIREKSIAGELVATLPVASNLPWIAALIGGLPAAAGVYLVSKVFTRQVDRFSSGVYSINGPWADPEVKFERIFDNTASHKQAVASGTESQAEAETETATDTETEEPIPPG
jgi:uncharacterized protein (TIGR02099 family)